MSEALRMIGILCSENEKKVAREFLELFKTPWEFCVDGRRYDVVITTLEEFPKVEAGLTVAYSSKPIEIDSWKGITLAPAISNHLVGRDGCRIPIYGRLVSFCGEGDPAICSESASDVVALGLFETPQKVLRVGYDLFGETAFLLSCGQPVEYALIPTLEWHIALLRGWILDAGIPIVEIPPFPWGHRFIVCLTHDVDFVGIRRHKADHTMWGFVYRGFVGSLVGLLRGTCPFNRLVRNWIAVLSLPLVYIGLVEDFWSDFDAYAELEERLSPTFFLIPFKERPGQNIQGEHPAHRAARYDIGDVRQEVHDLTSRGFEIGLHGIDAWHDVEKAKREAERIVEATGQERIGVRMHWLCFGRGSPAVLEQAGLDYDASYGYNETVGYKGGTSQVFKPLGVERLLQLPLHIQDTALFYPGRLGLTDDQAWELCEALLDGALRFGGVLTVSWHGRSLAPERLWGDFYKHLLEELRARGAWFGSARQVVQWFRTRRAVVFEDCEFDGRIMRLRLKDAGEGSEPRWFLRIHGPRRGESSGSCGEATHSDVLWGGGSSMEIPLG